MNSKKHNQTELGRRNFMLAALFSPLLLKLVLSTESQVSSTLQLNNVAESFVILDGWVLLKDDLIEQKGYFHDN